MKNVAANHASTTHNSLGTTREIKREKETNARLVLQDRAHKAQIKRKRKERV